MLQTVWLRPGFVTRREGWFIDPKYTTSLAQYFCFFKGKSDAKTPSRQKSTHKTPLKTPVMQRAKMPRTVGKTPKTPTANSVKRPSKKSLMTPSIPDRQQPCKTPGTPLELARKKWVYQYFLLVLPKRYISNGYQPKDINEFGQINYLLLKIYLFQITRICCAIIPSMPRQRVQRHLQLCGGETFRWNWRVGRIYSMMNHLCFSKRVWFVPWKLIYAANKWSVSCCIDSK